MERLCLTRSIVLVGGGGGAAAAGGSAAAGGVRKLPPLSPSSSMLSAGLATSARVPRAAGFTGGGSGTAADSSEDERALRAMHNATARAHFPDASCAPLEDAEAEAAAAAAAESSAASSVATSDLACGMRLQLMGVGAFSTDPLVDQRATVQLYEQLARHVPLDERQRRQVEQFEKRCDEFQVGIARIGESRDALSAVLNQTSTVVSRLRALNERDGPALARLYEDDMLAENTTLAKALERYRKQQQKALERHHKQQHQRNDAAKTLAKALERHHKQQQQQQQRDDAAKAKTAKAAKTANNPDATAGGKTNGGRWGATRPLVTAVGLASAGGRGSNSRNGTKEAVPFQGTLQRFWSGQEQ